MFLFSEVFNAIVYAGFRAVTGRLFTDDEIRQVTSHAVGKYLADLLPEPADERVARERVDEAKNHIEQANAIITQLQDELGSQTQQLDKVLKDIEEKKQLAMRYEALANTGREQFSAFQLEMENALRKELAAQSEKGKKARRIASFIIWLVTLVLGAALGTYFKEIWIWLSELARSLVP